MEEAGFYEITEGEEVGAGASCCGETFCTLRIQLAQLEEGMSLEMHALTRCTRPSSWRMDPGSRHGMAGTVWEQFMASSAAGDLARPIQADFQLAFCSCQVRWVET